MATMSSSVIADPKLKQYRNEALLPFDSDENARAMRDALRSVRSQFGRKYPLILGGDRVPTEQQIVSTNPAHPSEIVGIHDAAGPELADRAITSATKAFENWRWTPVEERVGVLVRAADALRRRKFEFCAWLVYEVGKNWAEADGETAEAIDFLEFYSREALRLAEAKTPIQNCGERDELRYIPLGVGAVISPWNFPLAITAGMTGAAIVCGNTVVLKPSPDAPIVAAIFCSLLEECGLPAGVVNLCPGGVELGKALVEHPRTRFIAFTGSKAAGLDIHERAAHPQPGQIWIKRTVLEMGGKDSIIVDRDCDLDQAADGVLASAFGYNGQKCSACSRAIVDDAVYEVFVDKLLRRAETLQPGDPAENSAAGPVINRTAYERVLRYIEAGKKEGRLALGGVAVTAPSDGYYIAPTIFTEVSPTAVISQEEIFGPVLGVLRARNFDHALEIANNTEYGLTGAVYTNSRENMELARQRFHVGNLYFNRKCTGALVGAHPFGGFNMSGTDSKAGGSDYLYLFTQGKLVAEKLRP